MNDFCLLHNRENSFELWTSYLTRCDLFLQKQNEQKEKEKSELVKEMDQIKEQNENLKSNLQQLLKETDHLKVCLQSTCEIWNSVLQYHCEILTLMLLLGRNVDPNDKADGDTAT